MSHWLDELQQLVRDGKRSVLLTVAGARGSTPREVGAKMIVTTTETIGTIGGGQLEYQCVQEACKWLRYSDDFPENAAGRTLLKKFTLGANCGQCCGGVAEILFEEVPCEQSAWVDVLVRLRDAGIDASMVTARQSRTLSAKMIITPTESFTFGDGLAPNRPILDAARQVFRANAGAQRDVAKLASNVELPVLIEPVCAPSLKVVIFGAGHVGSACASVLSMLDSQIYLVDSRSGFLDQVFPGNVHGVESVDPAGFAAVALPNSYFLVMTHDHGLDFEICARILKRNDVAFCGLIGSRSKRRRFEKRFRALSLGEAAIARLTCPIGIDEINGKKPAEIAVAVAAQLQSLHESCIRVGADHDTDTRAVLRPVQVTRGSL